MKALLAIALVLAQDAAPPPLEPWRGSLAQGLAEVQRLSEAGKPDEALALADRILVPGRFARWRERATALPGWKRELVEAADPLFAAVGLSDLASSARGAVQFARGVVLSRAEKHPEAVEAFEKARALAGPGDLRLDATYDLGWTALVQGEALRAQIPELGGQAPAPPAASPPVPGEQKPDPLELARAAYLKAREHFVEHLKSDGQDADTRANAELVQKRLKELAAIQKKREEEKKKQEDQQKQDQKKNDQEKKDQDKKDQDKKDPSSQDQDPKKPDEKGKDEKEKDKDKEKQEKKDPQKDDASDADKKEKKEAQPQPTETGPLTKEEVMRILDTLKEREEEGKKLLEQLRRARRAKVKKDW